MPKIDWTNHEPTIKPGIYDFEVACADLRYGRDSGVEYFALVLKTSDGMTVIDNISFNEKAHNIKLAKLSALGLKGVEIVECEDLIGRRIRAAVKLQPDNRGEMRGVIDISAKGSKAGYFESDAGKAPAAKYAGDDFESDIPF